MTNQSLRCVIVGYGYCAQHLAPSLLADGIEVVATCRDPAQKRAAEGVRLLALDDADLPAMLEAAHYVLISVPPGEGQGNAEKLLYAVQMPRLQWLGYLSSTGVYGDHQGAWVNEDTPPAPFDARTHARLAAEQAWQRLASSKGWPLHIFRLAGIYGPGRNIAERLLTGRVQRIVKPGHVFSRIHVADIARILHTSIHQPHPGVIFNLADDLPAETDELLVYTAKRLGLPLPEAQAYDSAELSEMARSFYQVHRRIANDRVKQALGIKLAYPTYKEGLDAIIKELPEAYDQNATHAT